LSLGSDDVQTLNIIIRNIRECPGLNDLQNLLEGLLEENAVEHVTFKRVTQKDQLQKQL
jgi:hypothetical protein